LDVATEPDWRRYADYRDWTRNGCLVRIDVLADRDGPEHCSYQSVRVIITGSPLGARYSREDDSVEYIRDPLDLFGLAAQLGEDAVMPVGAVDTGYRSGHTELWIDPADASAIFVVDGERIERWPAGQELGCA
jgi:hypothetical protein